ncbi:hypothetical protein PILCRDRAFT_99421 [Piloderma croceum F 1598]|uniref:DUF659 domain-containing protein n=1 Tax=Piloderma croceum (strain F 1598) TaxID=765440 RepID=A0A0C3EVY3_PILCF|nr:hypothetical protein PILCRDRAFT_99421 [Piloderma croceum F 1598]
MMKMSQTMFTAHSMQMEWAAPIYAFFRPVLIVEYVEGHCCHTFQCAAKSCKLRGGKDKVTFSHRQHTKTESRTRRPEYYITLLATNSHDVKKVFANAQKHIAKRLQEYEGTLSFATDRWTSPKHKVFVAVTVHFANNGVPLCMILDVVEVAISHSGVNLAGAFADILAEFVH